MNAAGRLRNDGFIERYLPQVLEVCGKGEDMDLLLCVMDVYDGGKLEAAKARVRELLPESGLSGYFQDKVRERLEGPPEA